MLGRVPRCALRNRFASIVDSTGALSNAIHAHSARGALVCAGYIRIVRSRRWHGRLDSRSTLLVWCPVLELTTAPSRSRLRISTSEPRALASGRRDGTLVDGSVRAI